MVVVTIRVKIVRNATEILYPGSKQSGRDCKRAALPLNPSLRLPTKKKQKYQISWKPLQWKRSFSMRTDRRDEASGHFSQICDSA